MFMWGTRHEHVHEHELRVFLSETCRQSTDQAPTLPHTHTPCSSPGREGLRLNSQTPSTPSSSPPPPPCHPCHPWAWAASEDWWGKKLKGAQDHLGREFRALGT